MPAGKGSTLDLSASQSDGYRAEIDGLRAVSILSVVLYHARVSGFQAGYLGVDVFFVISGFLITGQLLSEAATTGTIQMAMFYARRVRRLVPGFLAMSLGATVLALAFLLPVTEQRLFGNSLSRSALFYYNIAVWRGGYAYDGEPAQEQALMHTWSLGVEEQFYLVWPLVCLFFLRVGRPLVGFVSVVATSLGASWWFLSRDVDAVFFLLPFRAWELGLGACIAAWPRVPSIRTQWAPTLVGAGLVLMALASRQPPHVTLWPQVAAAFGSALILRFGAGADPISGFLRQTPMVLLGRMSYVWYLWHWPFLAIARLAGSSDEQATPAWALLAGFVAALVTYVGIEGPIRQIRIDNPTRALVWGGTTLAIVAVLGRAIEIRSQRIEEQPENVAALTHSQRVPTAACEGQVSTLGCDLSASRVDDRPSLLLWGDSFARALSPALTDYSRRAGVKVRLLVRPGCPPFFGAVPANPKALSEPDRECRAWLRDVRVKLGVDAPRLLGVVLAARWPVYGKSAQEPDRRRMFGPGDLEIHEPRIVFGRGLGDTLDFLESIGLRALIVGAPPEFPFRVPGCLWRNPDQCLVNRNWGAESRAAARIGIAEALRGHPLAASTEIFDRLCPGSQCSAGTLAEPLLTDTNHLSPITARTRVLPILIRDLDWLRTPVGG